jgi:hypothetical protein
LAAALGIAAPTDGAASRSSAGLTTIKFAVAS